MFVRKYQSTPPPSWAVRELLVTFFYTFGMARPQDSNPRPHTPEGNTLPIELSRLGIVPKGLCHGVASTPELATRLIECQHRHGL